MQPGSTITGSSRTHRSAHPSQGSVATPTIEEPPRTSQKQISVESIPPRHAPSLALLPTLEMIPPAPFAPAPTPLEHDAPVLQHIVKPAQPTLPVTKPPSQQTRPIHPERSASSGRRPQRTAQQGTSAPATSSAGLKNIPLIGPVFSLFQ
jgi:hypothetical protein